MKNQNIICVVNQKGGVGKTTTSINLASALALKGQKVLLIDFDPQGNATSGLGIPRYNDEKGQIYHVLVGEKALSETIYPTKIKNLSLIPSNPHLVGVEVELVDAEQREFILKKALESPETPTFDYILIDCPPSLGLLTINALCAAHSFLIPLQCEYYALEGLSQLLHTAGLLRKNLNPSLKLEGILLTMFDKRNNLSHQVEEDIRHHFKERVFQSVIPRNVRLSEAPSHGLSILDYDDRCLGAQKYLKLSEEVLNKNLPVQKQNMLEEEIHV